MIGCPVALNAEQIATRAIRIGDRKIDEEPGDADLRMHLVSEPLQCPSDLLLKHTFHVAAGLSRDVEPTGSGIVQKQLEREDALPLRPLEVDDLVRNRGKD
jgi:hypothetical protein